MSAPLRVYWDLVPARAGGLESRTAHEFAGELASLKVFFVTLGFPEDKREDAGDIIRALKKGVAHVTLSVGSPDFLPDIETSTLADSLDFFPADSSPLKGSLEGFVKNVQGSKPLSVSIVPSKSGLGRVIELVRLALDAGIRTFNLTNPNLIYNRDQTADFILGNNERASLKAGLEGLLKPLGRDAGLNVHDLFLHQALALPGLGARMEYAGCQAGDAIAYIDRSGLVYPCASWPVPFGSLADKSFRNIWSEGERKALRERIGIQPAECAGCTEARVCKGGCRGLAWTLGGYDCKDPNCEQR